MHKVSLLSSCMKSFQQKSYFLLIFAEFSTFSKKKKNCHKVTWMTSISFEEVTCKVSDMQLQGKRSYGILANSSHIGRKSQSVNFWPVLLTCARKFFMANSVFPKVYMIPFLPRMVINSPYNMHGSPPLVALLQILLDLFLFIFVIKET